MKKFLLILIVLTAYLKSFGQPPAAPARLAGNQVYIDQSSGNPDSTKVGIFFGNAGFSWMTTGKQLDKRLGFYIPYTGALSNVNLGTHFLTAGGLGSSGQLSVTGATFLNGGAIIGNGTNLAFNNISNSVLYASIIHADPTTNNNYYLPAGKSGQIALTSDLTTGYVPYMGASSDLALGAHNLITTGTVNSADMSSSSNASMFTAFVGNQLHITGGGGLSFENNADPSFGFTIGSQGAQSILFQYDGVNANIRTLRFDHPTDRLQFNHNATTNVLAYLSDIGLRQGNILPTDPGAPASTILQGDSLVMAIYKLQKELNAVQLSGSYVDLTSTQAAIGGLKTFTTGVSSVGYSVRNSDGTSIYRIVNDSTRVVIRPSNSIAVSTGYDITQDLPTGYVTDGSVDYTSILQTALNNHLHVSMPPFPVGVYFSTATGLIPQNGAIIDFPTGAKLIMIPNAQPVVANTGYNYGFFKMQDLNNITINNPNLEGDLYTHLPAAQAIDGGGGMSIYIFGGHDIIINGGTIKNSVGDGIYVATSGATNSVPTHILINKTDVSHNGRNGISLTSCSLCLLQDVIANYEETYSPYTGIDVEPSTNRDLVDNIVINNPILLNTPQTANGGIVTQGLSVGLRRYYSPGTGQTASTITSKTSNVTVNNPTITGSNIGIKASLSLRSGDTNPNNVTVTGNFIVNNPRVSTNWAAANSAGSIDANWVYTINNPTLYDKNGVLVSTFSAAQTAFYHNDNQPGTLQIVNQAVNGSPITTVSGVTIPPPVVVTGTTALYFKDNDIHDYFNNIFMKSNTAPSLTGSYANPSWITSLPFTKITGVPTTASTLGLTDNFVYAIGTTPLTVGALPYVGTGGKLTQNPTFLAIDDATGSMGFRTTGTLPSNLTFGNGATEYFSNVADLVTNTQFIKYNWNGNTFHISSSSAGTLASTPRPIQFDIGLGVNSFSSLLLNNNGFTTTEYSNVPVFSFLRVNGNASAPTAVLNASPILRIASQGYNGTANSAATATMEMFSGENFTTTANGTGIRFATTNLGSTTLQNAFFIQPSSDVLVGQNFSTNANFQVVQSGVGIGLSATTAGSTTVTGTRSEFTNSFKFGDAITINGETRHVVSVVSDVSMTTDAWTATNTATAYTLGGATILQAKGNGIVSIPYQITSGSFVRTGGLSSQYLMADGSVSTGTSAGVASITGTANQVIASASTGAVTLSLPQSIATTSNVAFNNITANGNSSTFFKSLYINNSFGTPQSWELLNDLTGTNDGIFAIYNNTASTVALQISKTLKADFTSTLTGANIYSTSATPSVTLQAAAGSGATVSIVGNNQDGIITVTTGTSPTTGILCTVLMSGGFAYQNQCVPTVSVNAGTALAAGVTIQSFAVTPKPTTFAISAVGTALAASDIYMFNYHNGGY